MPSLDIFCLRIFIAFSRLSRTSTSIGFPKTGSIEPQWVPQPGAGVKLAEFINLYGCEIGDDTRIGAFVEIQKNATVGRRGKISSHTFICEGVTIEDHVFIGHGVMFINDSYPRATTASAS